tara:strand:+ start:35403 stop:36317 length:915 start_codon:yes stop_codon:yes gene_type:complete
MKFFNCLLLFIFSLNVFSSGSTGGGAGTASGQVSSNESKFEGEISEKLKEGILNYQGDAIGISHKDWDDIVKRHVTFNKDKTSSTINYSKVNINSLKKYTSALLSVSKANLDLKSVPFQKAYYFNLYNALTVELIVENLPLKSIKELGSGFPLFQSPWKRKFFKLFGEMSHLDRIEHVLVRSNEKLKDPLVHFAFNCASIGCPALLNKAFTEKNVEDLLQLATRNFLKDRSRNYFKDNTLYVSSIFKWYEEDFEQGLRGVNSLKDFFKMYSSSVTDNKRDKEIINSKNYKIKFTDYNWNLNDTK